MDTLATILDTGVIAIIRLDTSEGLIRAAEALAAGGVRAIEVTMTTPGALAAISALAEQAGDDTVVGAGSILDSESARAAILAGAEFLVMPNTDLGAIQVAKRYGKVVCPGALTPTEVVTAWQAGADAVKGFPSSLGGPAYIKALKGPLPQVRLVPVGGVSPENAGDFIAAGACAVGIGGKLVNAKLIADEAWDTIAASARAAIESVARGRA